MVHELKTDHEVFEDVLNELKTFEIRKNDRGFKVSDELWLRETVNTGKEMKAGASLVYTERMIAVTVSHILRGPIYGLSEGWVIMSIKRA